LKISQETGTKKASISVSYLPHAGFLLWLFFDLQAGDDIFFLHAD
jgi:hypothetical protein